MTTLLPLGDIDALYVAELVRPISPPNDFRALWRIYRALCRWQPDVVHTHMAKAGAVGRLAALLYNRTKGSKRRARVIHTYHGHVFESYFGSPSTRIFLLIERWLAHRTDVLIAISPALKHDLIVTYRIAREEQVRVIPLGFDLDRLAAINAADRERARGALDVPAGSIVVTTVGRLTGIKQHSLFLQTAALLAPLRPFVFLIAGDGELRHELEERAKALGIGPRVRFLGWRGDLDQIYGATDVFVLTSRNEGTPVALIEAMASGVASVSTDVGGVRDVIADPRSGTLVPFGQPQLLADAVMRFAESAALRQETGASAREAVRRRFDVKRLRSDIGSLYAELLGNAAASG